MPVVILDSMQIGWLRMMNICGLGLMLLSGRHRNLALFHSALTTDDLAAIRDCTHKGWALGSEQFRTHIEKLGKRQAASKGVGRPRKQVAPDNYRV